MNSRWGEVDVGAAADGRKSGSAPKSLPMHASSRRALLGALAANLGIAATKFVVGGVTGSSVMIAEGIHSLVDTGNSGLMLYGQSRSRRAADEAHPFGYGMELYFWSFVDAMVVFAGGGGLSVYEGIRAVLQPRVTTLLLPNYLVIAVAAVFEGISLAIGLREFAAYRRERKFVGSTLSVMRASKNPAMFLAVLEDSTALVGLSIAALGLTLSHFLAIPQLDGVASILIGLVLVLEASLLGLECRGLIIGESARSVVVDQIRQVAALHDELGVIEDLRTLQLGADSILVVMQVRFLVSAVVGDLERATARLVRELRTAIPSIKHVAFDFVSGRDAETGATRVGV